MKLINTVGTMIFGSAILTIYAPDSAVQAQQSCHPSYTNVCIPPNGGDVDCAGGSGNGPRYVRGPVRVVGSDPYGLDRDGNGWGCE